MNSASAEIAPVLSRTEAESVADSILSRVKSKEVLIRVTSYSSAGVTFSNNDIRDVNGSAGAAVFVDLSLNGHEIRGATQSTSSEGIAALVDELDGMAKAQTTKSDGPLLAPPDSFSDPTLYYESTIAAMRPEAEGDLIRIAASQAEAAEMNGEGNIGVQARSALVVTTAGFKGYTRNTYAGFSLTVRTQSGTGSGWARGGAENILQVNVSDISKRAIGIARRSENPVAIEPGRYNVILEPEAVDALVGFILPYLGAEDADRGSSVFSKEGGGSKVGLKLVDERVQLLSDPQDPMLPFSPMDMSGWLVRRTEWIDKGVLRNLAYYPQYALKEGRAPLLNPQVARLEISGTRTSLSQMIAATRRGIWIHRLASVRVMNDRTLLLSGVTRDGTFLIENGKITKSIKNMRFSESPLLILNRLSAADAPVRSSLQMVCPRLKILDFEFTSLTDAI